MSFVKLTNRNHANTDIIKVHIAHQTHTNKQNIKKTLPAVALQHIYLHSITKTPKKHDKRQMVSKAKKKQTKKTEQTILI